MLCTFKSRPCLTVNAEWITEGLCGEVEHHFNWESETFCRLRGPQD